MSTTSSRSLEATGALQRYATLVASELDALATTPEAAPDGGPDAGASETAFAPATEPQVEPGDPLDAATWWAAHVRRPSSPRAGRPGPAAPSPYREVAAPGSPPEPRLDRRG